MISVRHRKHKPHLPCAGTEPHRGTEPPECGARTPVINFKHMQPNSSVCTHTPVSLLRLLAPCPKDTTVMGTSGRQGARGMCPSGDWVLAPRVQATEMVGQGRVALKQPPLQAGAERAQTTATRNTTAPEDIPQGRSASSWLPGHRRALGNWEPRPQTALGGFRPKC